MELGAGGGGVRASSAQHIRDETRLEPPRRAPQLASGAGGGTNNPVRKQKLPVTQGTRSGGRGAARGGGVQSSKGGERDFSGEGREGFLRGGERGISQGREGFLRGGERGISQGGGERDFSGEGREGFLRGREGFLRGGGESRCRKDRTFPIFSPFLRNSRSRQKDRKFPIFSPKFSSLVPPDSLLSRFSEAPGPRPVRNRRFRNGRAGGKHPIKPPDQRSPDQTTRSKKSRLNPRSKKSRLNPRSEHPIEVPIGVPAVR